MARKRKKVIELKPTDFVYVDVTHARNGKHEKWTRVKLDEVQEYASERKFFNVFATVQRFVSSVPLKDDEDSEKVVSPIFFDVDSSRTLSQLIELKRDFKAGVTHVTSKELEGLVPDDLLKHVRDFEIGIDLPEEAKEKLNELADNDPALKDFVWNKNIEVSRFDAVRLVEFFKSKFGLREEHIRVWFSGSKGFHIIVNESVAGIKPLDKKDMAGILKLIATQLELQLDLTSLDKQAIGTSRRMLRLANSMHHKSGLWKVELTHEELKMPVQKIREKAQQFDPKAKPYPEIELFAPNEELQAWYQSFVKKWEETKKLDTGTPTLTSEVLEQMPDIPVCVQFILERGILKPGDRNKATMALASFFKDKGTPINKTLEIMEDWVKRIPKGYTSTTNPKELWADTENVVRYIYEHDNYHFGCAFIRSLHGERKSGGSYEMVPCEGRKCPAHEEHRPNEEPAQVLHLSKTGKAILTGQKVATDVLVSGKLDTPYIVPKKVQYSCEHQPYCNKPCIMHKYAGAFEVEFDERDRILIETTAQSDNQTRGSLRQYIKPGCNKVYPTVVEYTNVTELLVVPMAERVNTVKNEEGEGMEMDDSGNEYVLRRIYSTDPDIRANQYYRIEGYVYPHPRNASATILSAHNEPKEDSADRFKVTPEIVEQFKVFQPSEAGFDALEEHVDKIVEDIEQNVTRVYDRRLPHIALLLTYHSCIGFYFQGAREKRGWLETILVGDSGQAKSQMVNKLMDFVSLGTMINAEATSRTGLSYKLEPMGEKWMIVWGQFPLSDRKLIAIDEFSELSKDDFGKLTQAREEGIIKVDRAARAETNARVRAVYLTNPADGKTLDSFTYPVESLTKLFHSPADIRRLDLALFLKSGDVSKDVLNAEYTPPEKQMITSEALRNSILWAWSRKPEQIIIDKRTEKAILKAANKLGDKYSHAKNIPLCELGNLRQKVARIAIALAAMVHSTDETHELVIVKPEHVDFVTEFIDVIYSAENCRFDAYNESQRAQSELSEEEEQKIVAKLTEMDEADRMPISLDILSMFMRNDVVKATDIRDMLAIETMLIQKRLRLFNEHMMVKRTRDGIQKLPKLIELIKRLKLRGLLKDQA